MKKIFALLFTVIILLSASISLASEKEITFQNIPWGSTNEEWTTALKEIYGDKFTNISKGSVTDYIDLQLKKKKLVSTLTNDMVPIRIASISDTIGGYDISSIYFYSVCAKGKENSDTETFLYQVCVCLLANSIKDAEKDLQKKLTEIYGNKSQTLKNYGAFKLTFRYWLGENDTYVMMGRSAPVDGKEMILVIYGKAINPEAFLDQFSTSETEAEATELYSEADPSDYKGL